VKNGSLVQMHLHSFVFEMFFTHTWNSLIAMLAGRDWYLFSAAFQACITPCIAFFFFFVGTGYHTSCLHGKNFSPVDWGLSLPSRSDSC
jgi:hypothetical protein